MTEGNCSLVGLLILAMQVFIAGSGFLQYLVDPRSSYLKVLRNQSFNSLNTDFTSEVHISFCFFHKERCNAGIHTSFAKEAEWEMAPVIVRVCTCSTSEAFSWRPVSSASPRSALGSSMRWENYGAEEAKEEQVYVGRSLIGPPNPFTLMPTPGGPITHTQYILSPWILRFAFPLCSHSITNLNIRVKNFSNALPTHKLGLEGCFGSKYFTLFSQMPEWELLGNSWNYLAQFRSLFHVKFSCG